MENFINNLVVSNILIVCALVAILNAIKKVLPQEMYKYLELIAICLGAVATIFYKGFGVESVLNGIVLGLASGKLYDKIVDMVFNQFKLGE
ncbi:MAG: hypothetical protein SOR77_08825 [Peptoniphilus sp.]|uniref:hypothetical protein n=1 Tax=Peptoniphilus sp. TaxID=1971214 RepID=UPI002A764B2A|nr:hypothetical protein [Peptoniphilus sp.]MDY2987721.1 hypothetical protein [Peptoniphilus sp.]